MYYPHSRLLLGSRSIQLLVIITFVFFFVFLSRVSVGFTSASTDLDADQMLNFFSGVTNVPTNWRNSPLVDWICSSSPCCTTTPSKFYFCDFPNTILQGRLNPNVFSSNLSFPLQRLTLTSDGSLSLASTSTTSFRWDGFPTSLLRLEMNNMRLDSTAGVTATIDTALLPRGMTHLKLNNIATDDIGPFSFANLPPSLTVFSLTNMPSLTGTMRSQDLPRSLVTLQIENLNLDGSLVYRSLPPNLNVLIFDTPGTQIVGTHAFRNLPRVLRTYRVKNCEQIVSGASWRLDELPPPIEEFTIENTGYTSGATNDLNWTSLAMFSSMKILSIQTHSGMQGPIDISRLPPKLETLNLIGTKFTGNVDLRTIPDTLQTLRLNNNQLNGQLLLPATRPSRYSNLTIINVATNSLTGTIDGSKFPLSLKQFIAGNNKFNSIVNFNSFGDDLTQLSINQNPKMNGTLEWDGTSLPNLETLQVYVCNNLKTSNLGDLSLAPRSLKFLLCGTNAMTSILDFTNCPPNLEEVNFGGNRMTRVRGLETRISSSNFKSLTLWGNPTLNGSINISSLGDKLETFHIFSSQFESLGRADGDVFSSSSLPQSLQSFRASQNRIKLRGSGFDFNHLPPNLTEFDLSSNDIKQASAVLNSSLSLPVSFQSLEKQMEFCRNLLTGNSWKNFDFCNITATRTISQTKGTRSTSLSNEETQTFEETFSPTISESFSKSKSIVDFERDWMLNVVLSGVRNLPPEWSYTRLKDWRCPPSSTKTYLCCPYDSAAKLYDCNFKSGTFSDGGSVSIHFPKEYPLRSFTFVSMPNISGKIRIHQLPSALTHLKVEQTKIGADNLWFYGLPPKIVSLELCDNDINLPDISFSDTPSSLKVLRLCGNKIRGSRNFRGVPQNMTMFDLSRNLFTGIVPWKNLPFGIQHVNLAENLFEGDLSASFLKQLPPSIVSLNISHNHFTGTPNLYGTLPPNLEVLDFSFMNNNHNNKQPVPSPNFSNLNSTSIREIYATNSRFGWRLDTATNLLSAPSLARLVLKDNLFEGDFEVQDSLLPSGILSDVQKFCDDILTGNNFRESKTCDWTHSLSTSSSKSQIENSTSLSESPPSSSSTLSSSDQTLSFSGDIFNSSSASSSASLSEHGDDKSRTTTSTQSLSSSILSSTFTVPLTVTADTLTISKSNTIYIPPTPVKRHEVLKTTLEVSASVAALATPTVASAAAIVSRQTAIARSFGGKNETCGGPTRLDSLSFFEDPFGWDLNPQKCWGQLGGIVLGNLLLCFVIPLGFWIIFASYFAIKTRKIPGFYDGMENGWTMEVISIVCYGLLVPPAISAALVAAVRCSWGYGGMLAALCYVFFTIFLVYFLFQRERFEQFFWKKYRVPKHGRKSNWRIPKRIVHFVFCPSGVWRWEVDEEEIKRKDREKEEHQKRSLIDDSKKKNKSNDTNKSNDDDDDDDDVPLISSSSSPKSKNEQLLAELEALDEEQKKVVDLINEIEGEDVSATTIIRKPSKTSHEKESKEEKSSTKKSFENENDQPDQDQDQDQEEEDQEEEIIEKLQQESEEQQQLKFKKRLAYAHLRFNVVDRLLDKYNKRSWWFLCVEIGARMVMTIGPAIAEAVPFEISCTILRAIYLLCINMLLIAILGRRPYVHRALFFASALATFVEDVVLVLLIIMGKDVAEEAAPWLLIVVQIIATTLTLGIEFVEFGLHPRYKWVRGKIIRHHRRYASIEDELEAHENGEEGDENKKSNSETSSSDEDCDQELITSIDQLKGLSADERSVLRKSRIGMSLQELDEMDQKELTLLMNRRRLLQRHENQNRNDDGDDDFDTNNNDDDEDMFERLDKRLRRAYAELAAEDVFIVPKSEKYVDAKIKFEDLVNL